jgi:hypothetical protein
MYCTCLGDVFTHAEGLLKSSSACLCKNVIAGYMCKVRRDRIGHSALYGGQFPSNEQVTLTVSVGQGV